MIESPNYLNSKTIAYLKKNYNVIALLGLNHYYADMSQLEDILRSTRKEKFDANDRYVIEHSDTDYYLPGCPYGLSIFNLVRIFLHVDIPFNNLLLITNHYNIADEFKFLIPRYMHDHNFPTIIDSCFTCFTQISQAYISPEPNIDVDAITRHGISMMGRPRCHRNILRNEIFNSNIHKNFAISYHGAEHAP